MVLYPGEPDRFFERILGWPVGVTFGGEADLGIVTGVCDVTGQFYYPQNIVNLVQIADPVMKMSGHWSDLHVTRL